MSTRPKRAPSLFAAAGLDRDAPRPLADKLRPTRLAEVVGQDHLLGPDGALTRMLETRTLGSLGFWGPPGTGKPTVARLLAEATELHFEQISAIFTGVADLRRGFEAARPRRWARKDETFDAEKLAQVVQRRAPIYDKAQDSHYNLISALHKSVRGSDPDAALYYLCRMLDAGEDPLYIARRVVRMAVEDIGLADPQALVVADRKSTRLNSSHLVISYAVFCLKK